MSPGLNFMQVIRHLSQGSLYCRDPRGPSFGWEPYGRSAVTRAVLIARLRCCTDPVLHSVKGSKGLFDDKRVAFQPEPLVRRHDARARGIMTLSPALKRGPPTIVLQGAGMP